MDEFDRQVERLVGVGVSSGQRLGVSLEPLRPMLPRVHPRAGRRPGADFVVVPAPRSVDLEALVPHMTLAGGERPGILDRNHGSEGLEPYRDLPELKVPASEPYLLIDVERGEEFCNVRPGDAVEQVLARGRTPLTILEGIVLQLVRPDLLVKNHCFMLAGSRRGDRRVPALWISDGAPKLGWCWEGNPHTWLGTASAAERRAAG